MKQNVSFETARKIVKFLMALAVVLCILALFIGDRSSFSMYAAIIAVVCIVATGFVVAIGMKCPYCGHVIVRKCLVVKICPHCGRDLVSGLKSKKKKR